MQWSELAFPFPSMIDWTKVLIDEPLATVDTLLERISRIGPRELERRTSYLRLVAPWLLFDRAAGLPDAADAALWELEQRILGPDVPRPRHIPKQLKY